MSHNLGKKNVVSPRLLSAFFAGLLMLFGTLVILAPVSLADPPDPGFALQFDGEDDYVFLEQTSLIMTTGWTTTKTVEVWVKPTDIATNSVTCTADLPSQCGVANIDAIFGDLARWWGISRGTINGEDKIWVWNTHYEGSTPTIRQIGIDYTLNEWIHIALVHSDGVLRAYKNGVEVGSVPSGATIIPIGSDGTPNSPELFFGGMVKDHPQNPKKWGFDGEIDEVRIWNSARTETELVENMNRPLTGSEPDLAAYYQMTNGSGITVTDNSGHGWTGSLIDFEDGTPPQWVTSGAFSAPEPNLPPTADSQSVSTAEDTSVGITLTGTDPNSDTITFTLVSQPQHGALTGSPPNLTYTPAANFNGIDSFSYIADDGQATSAPATATITVTSVNDPPVAVDDTTVAVTNLAVIIPVLNNDSDVDGDALSVISVGNGQHGTATTDGTTVSYTSAPAFVGTDSFTYTIDDGPMHLTDTARVTVTVVASNEPPVAADDTAETVADTPVEINVLGNDTDPEGGTLTISSVGLAANGVVTNNFSSITYAPTSLFTGTDVFTYQVFDGINGYDTAAVTVTVLPVNIAPVAVDDRAYTNLDAPVTIDVLGNDSDANGDPLSISAVGTASNGQVVNNGADISYTPNTGYSGVDVFTYTVADNRMGTDTASVTVTVGAGNALRFDGENDFVTLAGVSSMMASTWATTKTLELWVKPTGTATCTVAAHLCSANSVDSIFGDRPRSWGISRGPVNGEDKIWVWNFDGQVRQIGIDYTVDEWMYIALVQGNGMLRAYKNGAEVGSMPTGATVGGTTLYIGGSIKDANSNWTFSGDIDEVRVWNIVRSQAELMADMSHPLAGTESGLAAYYQMSDGGGATLTDDSGHGWTGTLTDYNGGALPEWVPSGAFNITISNAAPNAVNDTVNVPRNTAVTINVLGNDSDPDGNQLTITAVGTPSHGTAASNGQTITYTPTTDYTGDDSFWYTIADNFGSSDTATVTVSISDTRYIFLPLILSGN